MKLQDMFTDKPEFSLSITGKTYSFRAPNLEDRARFRDILGGDENAQKVFKELQWDIIARLAYRLLDQKEEFLATKEDRIDDDGVKETVLITGPAKLMQAVKNIDEATKMLMALVNAMRLGDPLIDEYIGELSAEEKKTTKSPTGKKSSTQSPQNMDTPQVSSAP